MNYVKHSLVVGLCAFNLCSCMISDNESYTANYQTYVYDNSLVNYSTSSVGYGSSSGDKMVSVPESYHVGEYHSPVSFKDRDRAWVSSQKPDSYTIELAKSDKAALVAKKLYNTPKNDHMAQIKYQANGVPYYKGFYGTYPDAASAQKALAELPDTIKQGASVTQWGSEQQNIE